MEIERRNSFSAMNTLMNLEERLKKLLEASPEQIQAIDSILISGVHKKTIDVTGPLLLGMNASAKFLGVSRTTLWRMTKVGFLERIEILPGNFLFRRADLEAIANRQRRSPSS
jgi:hypothetical protein